MITAVPFDRAVAVRQSGYSAAMRNLARLTLGVFVISLGGCDAPERPRKVFEISSALSATEFIHCITISSGQEHFPGIAAIHTRDWGPHSYYLTETGVWIDVSSNGSRSKIEVRSEEPLSQAQSAYLRDCATRPFRV